MVVCVGCILGSFAAFWAILLVVRDPVSDVAYFRLYSSMYPVWGHPADGCERVTEQRVVAVRKSKDTTELRFAPVRWLYDGLVCPLMIVDADKKQVAIHYIDPVQRNAVTTQSTENVRFGSIMGNDAVNAMFSWTTVRTIGIETNWLDVSVVFSTQCARDTTPRKACDILRMLIRQALPALTRISSE